MKAICAAIVVVATFVAGCTTPDPGMTPIVTLEHRQCTAAPDFTQALALKVDPKSAKETKAEVTESAPCFADDRGPSAYAVFAIPPLVGQYTIEVDSMSAGTAMLAPRILLYGADGTLKRTLMEKQIIFRGKGLAAVFRNHDDERYLVVASDPAVCGQSSSRIVGGTMVTPVCTGVICLESHTGYENQNNTMLSHNGRLLVTLTPIEKAK